MCSTRFRKLATLYFGPFPIEDRIDKVAYKVTLPVRVVIHPILHVSRLRKKIPLDAQLANPTNFMAELRLVAILDKKNVKRGNKAAVKLLI